jgi:Signal peptidase, peptidase S26
MDNMGGRFMKIPLGHVWLQGDNLPFSKDSRVYGAVPEATLKGRVLARVYLPSIRLTLDFTSQLAILRSTAKLTGRCPS